MTNELREALEKISRSLDAEISAHRCGCPHPCEDYLVHPGPCGTRTAEAFRNIKVIADKALASLSEVAIPIDQSVVAGLAFALWDSENTTRLQRAEDQPEAIERAKRLLHWISFHGLTLLRRTASTDRSPAPSAGDGWILVAQQQPAPHQRYMVRRAGLIHTATPCYGMHEPWWVQKGFRNGEEYQPADMKPSDEWRPLPSPPNPPPS